MLYFKQKEDDLLTNAQIKGIRNHDNGRAFENIILAACERYRIEGKADIDKTPEPMSIIKNMGQGKFMAHFAKKAQPDFQGTLAGGQSICFEAKHTESAQIQQSAVTDEQAKVLSRKEKLGAECFVLVSFGFKAYYKIPWNVWENMKENFGHKYMKPEEIEKYRLSHSGGPMINFIT